MMNEIDALPYLRSLLYKRVYRPFVDTESHEYIEKLRQAYEPIEFDALVGSLEWSVSNPKYDYSSLLGAVNMTNEDIRSYFASILSMTR